MELKFEKKKCENFIFWKLNDFFFGILEVTTRMTNERALRVGIKSKPPTLVIVYNLLADGIQKRLRKIPLKVRLRTK